MKRSQSGHHSEGVVLVEGDSTAIIEHTHRDQATAPS